MIKEKEKLKAKSLFSSMLLALSSKLNPKDLT